MFTQFYKDFLFFQLYFSLKTASLKNICLHNCVKACLCFQFLSENSFHLYHLSAPNQNNTAISNQIIWEQGYSIDNYVHPSIYPSSIYIPNYLIICLQIHLFIYIYIFPSIHSVQLALSSGLLSTICLQAQRDTTTKGWGVKTGQDKASNIMTNKHRS